MNIRSYLDGSHLATTRGEVVVTGWVASMEAVPGIGGGIHRFMIAAGRDHESKILWVRAISKNTFRSAGIEAGMRICLVGVQGEPCAYGRPTVLVTSIKQSPSPFLADMDELVQSCPPSCDDICAA